MPGIVFELWDVFSQERFRGNALAVFTNATPLPEAQLGAIAREMGHSETAFVFPRTRALERREGVRVRIFSKAGWEMKFAGHPVLGTAFALWTRVPRRTQADGAGIQLLLPIGRVPVDFRKLADGGWEGEMTQPAPIFAETHSPEDLAVLLGLGTEDIDSTLPLQTVSTGRPNVLVLLKSLEHLSKAIVDWRALDNYFANGDRERGIYLLTRDVEMPSAQFHARKPGRTGDDPVTGSAAGCAIAWLVKYGAAASGKRIVIEQGTEVNRRGELSASAEMVGDKVTNVKVGGQAVLSAHGFLD